jgi:Protein of unknown function (DUF3040)
MSLKDDEQRVLDAIENQLRTDDPQLMHCFSAFCRVTPSIKPVKGRERVAPHRRKAQRGRHRHTDRQAYAIVIELVLVIIAVVLVVLLMLGAVWMLAALSH